jgi:hypothetical protein
VQQLVGGDLHEGPAGLGHRAGVDGAMSGTV